jgi:hypothetical protein
MDEQIAIAREAAGSWAWAVQGVELRSSAGPLVHIRYTARPASADLATLIAMADTEEVVRLRLLRAIRDLGT